MGDLHFFPILDIAAHERTANNYREAQAILDGWRSGLANSTATSGLVGVVDYRCPPYDDDNYHGEGITEPAMQFSWPARARIFPHLCPKCNGEGDVPRLDTSTTAASNRICPVCNGAKVLWG